MSEVALHREPETEALAREEREPFLASFRADLFRHFVYFRDISLAKKVAHCLQVEGIWACFVYRFGRALKTRPLPPIASQAAWFLFRFLEVVVRIASGIHLDVEARIAPGFYVGHHGAIFVGPGVRIGPNSSIGQMCYVGAAAIGTCAPVLGERCFLGTGCKVLGPLHIGDEVLVGAGAVVLMDLPRSAVVVGNPARIVSHKGTAEVIYLGDGNLPVTGERALESMLDR
jgi:serine O-acetyltransferase